MSQNNKVRYAWFSLGDVSSSATIVFDNLTNMAIISFLLTVVFGMPSRIVFKHIIPGLSVGIMFGNLILMYFAFRLAKKLGRSDVTAFPSGLDAPTCIGLTLAVVGPTFLLFKSQGMTPDQAALHSWYISCACTFFIGLVKFIFSFFASKIKNLLPTVALLGGIAGVSIGLIAFFPLLSMLQFPLASFLVLAVIVMVYFAGYQLPGNLPAILVAIIIGTAAYYIFQIILTGHSHIPAPASAEITLPTPDFAFLGAAHIAIKYFSIALPFALLVIFGTLSVAESARVLGEEYSAKDLLLVDGIATMLMGIFGGTAQTTSYAGFPAYKKMDSRLGYLLINVLIIGFGAWFGLVGYIINLVPNAILAPVLLFIGIEIVMQVFLISDKKYFPAAVLGLFPSIAHMVEIKLTSNPDLVSMPKLNTILHTVNNGQLSDIAALVTFGNGFIITGTLWAALLCYLIERQIVASIVVCLIMAVGTLFGIIHSLNLDGSMYWIGNLSANDQLILWNIAGGYILFAVTSLIIHILNTGKKANSHY